MSTSFNKDMNIITNFLKDMDIIAALDDQPNDVGGLTAAELKAKFDEGGKAIQSYINDTLIPEVLGLDATELARKQNESERLAAESQRVAAEAQRTASEIDRTAAEAQRISAENIRIDAENTRALAEQQRADETAGIIAVATVQAQHSAASASVALEKATSASDNAISAANSAKNAADSHTSAQTCAAHAASYSADAATSATCAKSWAVGGTSTRTDEDYNNAKFWAEQAFHAAGGGVVSFNGRSGTVLSQEGDYTADMVGAIARVKTSIPGNLASFTANGNLQDSGKNITDFCAAPLNSSLSFYVDTHTGADTNDGLSPTSSKKTIQSAINAIPKLLTGGRVIINIAPGEYAENLLILGFTGVGAVQASIYLSATGAVEDTKLIGSIQICSAAPIWLRNLTLSGSNTAMPLINAYFSCISITGCILDATNVGEALPAVQSSVGQLYITNTSISNSKSSAIQMSGSLFVYNLTGYGNQIGMQNFDPIGRIGLITTSKLDTDFAEILYLKGQGGTIIENGALV